MSPRAQSSVDAPRALVLGGARAGEREVDEVAARIADALDRLGLAAERVTLREVDVAPCVGCFDCWVRTPGVCRTRDAGRDLARAFVRARVVALVTPVTFGGYSSELKKAIDRLLGISLPFFTWRGGEVRHRLRYALRPALLVVGVLPAPDPDQERTFRELARRNAANLAPPAFASRVLVRRGGDEGPLEPALLGAIASLAERAAAGPRAGTSGGEA